MSNINERELLSKVLLVRLVEQGSFMYTPNVFIAAEPFIKQMS